jgi:hypothetical protein
MTTLCQGSETLVDKFQYIIEASFDVDEMIARKRVYKRVIFKV